MRLFQIRLLYWKKSLILIQEKNTYDNGKCEALLLDSLKDHGSLTKPEIVRLLWDVLPNQQDDKQKNNKLDYLLKRLRKAGKIWTERNVVTSVWHLTEKQLNSVRLQALFREMTHTCYTFKSYIIIDNQAFMLKSSLTELFP